VKHLPGGRQVALAGALADGVDLEHVATEAEVPIQHIPEMVMFVRVMVELCLVGVAGDAVEAVEVEVPVAPVRAIVATPLAVKA